MGCDNDDSNDEEDRIIMGLDNESDDQDNDIKDKLCDDVQTPLERYIMKSEDIKYRLIAWVKSLYVLGEVMKKTRRVSPN